MGCGRSSRGSGRRRHGRTVPHIHVQHGEVRGATLASGQVLPPGGIAVGTEDLALTGADYVALGHIHKGAELPPTNRAHVDHVRGSAPTRSTWGELDRKQFHVVDLSSENGFENIGTVPYGHPARIKLELDR